jgi:hypothetical protein
MIREFEDLDDKMQRIYDLLGKRLKAICTDAKFCVSTEIFVRLDLQPSASCQWQQSRRHEYKDFYSYKGYTFKQ